MKITLEKTNKKRILLGLTLSLVCFVLCWIVSGSLVKSAVLALFFVMISCIQLKLPKPLNLPITLLSFLMSGAAALFLSQFVQNEGLASLQEGMALRGFCCCVLFACIAYVVFPNIRFSTIAAVGIPLFLSTANWFVYHFRGSELVPVDFTSIGTAMNVANKYHFTITPNMVYPLL